jgi:hypothetical protein
MGADFARAALAAGHAVVATGEAATRCPRPWDSRMISLRRRDPAKLARVLITIASQEPPPRRFIAGADAIATAEQKISDLKAQIEAHRELSTPLAFD